MRQHAGYAPGRADSTACELMRRPRVQARLKELMKQRQEEYAVDVKYFRDKLLTVLEADYTKWADLGRYGAAEDELAEMPDHIKKLVQGLERTDTYDRETGNLLSSRFKFKLIDKTKCLEMLGRTTGSFVDNVNIKADVEVKHTFTDLVEKADIIANARNVGSS